MGGNHVPMGMASTKNNRMSDYYRPFTLIASQHAGHEYLVQYDVQKKRLLFKTEKDTVELPARGMDFTCEEMRTLKLNDYHFESTVFDGKEFVLQSMIFKDDAVIFSLTDDLTEYYQYIFFIKEDMVKKEILEPTYYDKKTGTSDSLNFQVFDDNMYFDYPKGLLVTESDLAYFSYPYLLTVYKLSQDSLSLIGSAQIRHNNFEKMKTLHRNSSFVYQWMLKESAEKLIGRTA